MHSITSYINYVTSGPISTLLIHLTAHLDRMRVNGIFLHRHASPSTFLLKQTRLNRGTDSKQTSPDDKTSGIRADIPNMNYVKDTDTVSKRKKICWVCDWTCLYANCEVMYTWSYDFCKKSYVFWDVEYSYSNKQFLFHYYTNFNM